MCGAGFSVLVRVSAASSASQPGLRPSPVVGRACRKCFPFQLANYVGVGVGKEDDGKINEKLRRDAVASGSNRERGWSRREGVAEAEAEACGSSGARFYDMERTHKKKARQTLKRKRRKRKRKSKKETNNKMLRPFLFPFTHPSSLFLSPPSLSLLALGFYGRQRRVPLELRVQRAVPQRGSNGDANKVAATTTKIEDDCKGRGVQGGESGLALVRHFENRLLAIIVSSVIKFKRGVRRQKGVAPHTTPCPVTFLLQLRIVTKATAIPL